MAKKISKAKYIKFKFDFIEHRYPYVCITIPGNEFEKMQPYVEVRFFQFDLGKMRFIFKPIVNIKMGSGFIHPDEAYKWSQVFEAASRVANQEMPTYIDQKDKTKIITTWMQVTEAKKELEALYG